MKVNYLIHIKQPLNLTGKSYGLYNVNSCLCVLLEPMKNFNDVGKTNTGIFRRFRLIFYF